MAKFNYYDTSDQLQTVEAPDSATALKTAPNLGVHSGVQAIPVDNLSTPVQTPTIPTPTTPSDTSGIMAGLTAGATNPTPTVATPAPLPDNSFADLFKQFMGDTEARPNQGNEFANMLGKSPEQIVQERAAREQTVNDLNAQLDAINKGATAAQLDLESRAAGKDVTTGFLGKQQQEISRQAAIKGLPISAQLQAAQGNLKAAQSNIETLFRLKSEDAQNAYNDRKAQREAIYNFATEEQKRRLDKLEKEETRKYEAEKDKLNFERDKEMLRYKQQLEMSAGGAGTPTIKEINGRDMQWNPNTQRWENITTEQSETNILKLTRDQENIRRITEMTKSGGLGSAVGTTFLTRKPEGFWGSLGAIASVVGIPSFIGGVYRTMTGERQNFISGVEQLQSTLSLDSLINAKSQGATFGALSDTEMRILTASATKLGSWTMKDKDGNITGFNANEKDLKKELDKINNFAKLDYILKGGNPSDIEAQVMPDGTIWVTNSDGTVTQLQ